MVSPATCPNDNYEPNNNFSQAVAIPVVNGFRLNASLCPNGDSDFYSFQVTLIPFANELNSYLQPRMFWFLINLDL